MTWRHQEGHFNHVDNNTFKVQPYIPSSVDTTCEPNSMMRIHKQRSIMYTLRKCVSELDVNIFASLESQNTDCERSRLTFKERSNEEETVRTRFESVHRKLQRTAKYFFQSSHELIDGTDAFLISDRILFGKHFLCHLVTRKNIGAIRLRNEKTLLVYSKEVCIVFSSLKSHFWQRSESIVFIRSLLLPTLAHCLWKDNNHYEHLCIGIGTIRCFWFLSFDNFNPFLLVVCSHSNSLTRVTVILPTCSFLICVQYCSACWSYATVKISHPCRSRLRCWFISIHLAGQCTYNGTSLQVANGFISDTSDFRVTPTGLAAGSLVYSCGSGFALNPVIGGRLTCLTSGAWTTLPVCQSEYD